MIVITGATGTVGRHLVRLLPPDEVRAVTRSRSQAGIPAGIDVIQGDPSRPETLRAALRDATALFVHPRAVRDTATDLVRLATDSGVRRLVVLSSANVDDDLTAQPARYRGDRNKETEDAVISSGLPWVSLRPTYFAANTLQTWGEQIRAGDEVRGIYAGFRESPLDERDLAEVAAHALLTTDLDGRRLVLTGPQSLSHEEIVAVIGEIIGRPLRYREIPPDTAATGMLRRGLPEPYVRALMARYAAHLEHPQHPPTDHVATILGRPARTFAQWVTDHHTAFTS